MRNFSIKEAIKYGWGLFKNNKKTLVLATLVFLIFNSRTDMKIDTLSISGESLLLIILGVALYILGILVQVGWYKSLLNLMDGKQVMVREMFSYGRLFFKYFGTIIIFVLAAGVVALMLTFVSIPLFVSQPVLAFIISAVTVVYVVYFLVRFSFAPFLVIDKEVRIIEAFKESSRITDGVRWKLLWLFVVLALLNILGVMVLFVGVLVSIPVTALAHLYIYRKLSQ